MIRKMGGKPAFLGYKGFPSSSCISVNEEVVHGIPNGKSLKEGDIVKIDVGVEYKGFYGDAAKTYAVGKIEESLKRLMRITEKSLYLGIEQAKPMNRIGDISGVIQEYVEKNGFNVVRELGGHGVGIYLHEDPIIPNFGKKGTGILLKRGMTIAIEPMVNMGTWEVKVLKDGWTHVTADKKPSAHFEHTVLVEDPPVILTQI
jgi:methionyl aminopeptidase